MSIAAKGPHVSFPGLDVSRGWARRDRGGGARVRRRDRGVAGRRQRRARGVGTAHDGGGLHQDRDRAVRQPRRLRVRRRPGALRRQEHVRLARRPVLHDGRERSGHRTHGERSRDLRRGARRRDLRRSVGRDLPERLHGQARHGRQRDGVRVRPAVREHLLQQDRRLRRLQPAPSRGRRLRGWTAAA